MCGYRQGWVGGMGVEIKGEIKTKKAVAKMPPLHKIVREKVNKGHIRGQSPKYGWWLSQSIGTSGYSFKIFLCIQILQNELT